jgi:hypothetical protein
MGRIVLMTKPLKPGVLQKSGMAAAPVAIGCHPLTNQVFMLSYKIFLVTPPKGLLKFDEFSHSLCVYEENGVS